MRGWSKTLRSRQSHPLEWISNGTWSEFVDNEIEDKSEYVLRRWEGRREGGY